MEITENIQKARYAMEKITKCTRRKQGRITAGCIMGCAIVISMLIMTSFVYAATIRVPDDYVSIQEAIDAASAGDTVLVAKGEYVGDITMKAGVDIIGTVRRYPVIEGKITGAAETRFENFTVKGYNIPNSVLYECDGGTGIEIKSNIFMDASSEPLTAIRLTNVAGAEIIDNIIHTRVSDDGMSLTAVEFSGDGVLFMNNSIYADAPMTKGIVVSGTNHTVKNNIVAAYARGEGNSAVAVQADDPLQLSYNILVGDLAGKTRLLNGNILNSDPCWLLRRSTFIPDTFLWLRAKSPAIDAAEPGILYNAGVRNIGAFIGYSFKVSDTEGLQRAIDNASPGDTIIVNPGYYTLKNDLRITKNITIKSRNSNPDQCILNLGEHVIYIKDTSVTVPRRGWLDPTPREANEYDARLNYKLTSVTLEGLTITGYRESLEKEGYAQGQRAYDPARAIEDNGPIQNYAKQLTIRKCKIIDNHGIKVSAVYTKWSSKTKIEETLIADNRNFDPGFGTKAWEAYGYWSYFLNPWRDDRSSWKTCGVLYSNGEGYEIWKSTIAGNINESDPEKVVYGAIMMRNGGAWIEDTVLCENGGSGADSKDYVSVWRGSKSTNPQEWRIRKLTYSCIQVPALHSWSITRYNNIIDNPQFADAEHGDYHLTEESPCLGKSSQQRDIGAYDFYEYYQYGYGYGTYWKKAAPRRGLPRRTEETPL